MEGLRLRFLQPLVWSLVVLVERVFYWKKLNNAEWNCQHELIEQFLMERLLMNYSQKFSVYLVQLIKFHQNHEI